MPLWLFFTTGCSLYFLFLLFVFLTASCLTFLIWKMFYNIIQQHSHFTRYSNIPIIALPILKALFYTCTTLFDSLQNHIKNAELKRSVMTPCLVCTASTICSVMSIVKLVKSKPHKSEQAFKKTLSIHALCI